MRLRIATFTELTVDELHAILKLRCDVFVVEQACPYQDVDGRDDEPGTLHAWLDHGGGPATYLRILAEPNGDTRIGRVVTGKAHRGSGLGRQLMAAALDRTGDTPVVLDAQAHLERFYGGFGFAVTGPEYLDDGIPHVPMRRPG